jgi:glycosyltransferase involved in cell wall biosynthesis
MTHILHISCDYIDEIDNQKTAAVFNLVSNSTQFEHTIFSLNRTIVPTQGTRCVRRGQLYSMNYRGLPFGIGLRFFLRRTAKRLLRMMQNRDIRPDIIHCHKLTIEGPIGYYISKKLNVPMTCSFRGDTDFKLIRFKPGYRALYRKILRHSSGLLFIAPWAKLKLENMWPNTVPQQSVVLPNIVDLSSDRSDIDAQISNRLVTVCHLKDYKRKNLIRLIKATDACISEGLDISLDIIGGGPDEVVTLLEEQIRRLQNPSRFKLLGPYTRSEVESTLDRYAALVLPSYPETFGMVYLEALQSGIPILHSRQAGVDGYFDGKSVSVAVDAGSIDSIKSGITLIYEKQREFKANIRQLAESGYLEIFNTPNIVQNYEKAIGQAMEHFRSVQHP